MEKILNIDNEVDLVVIARIILRSWWIVGLSVLLFGVAATVYVRSATKWYMADIDVIQVENQPMVGGVGQLAGLAGLVGLDVSSTMSAKVPLAVLGSRGFARDFIVDENLTDTLLGQKGGDVRDAMEIFDRDVRSVVEDRKTGVITLRITWKNPETAAAWANLLVEKVNARLREKALAEAERNIKYLRGEIAATNITSLQQSISRVLEAEMQKMLLARGKDEFAFEIVDRAVVPKHKYRPRLLFYGSAGVVVGGVVGLFLALMLHFFRVKRAAQSVSACG